MHSLEDDLKVDGETAREAWMSEDWLYGGLNDFMRLRAEWVEYCLERGIEP